MSASLVGSEMCIRDRAPRGRLAVGGSPGATSSCACSPGGKSGPDIAETCLLYTSDAADDM
eukprot:1731519-Alexandrium_andersonii.AAC.1